MNRRALLLAGLGLALGQSDAASSRPKAGDLFVRNGDAAKTPLTPDDIPLGAAQTLAWAMDPAGTVRSGSRLNQVLLLRLDPERSRRRPARGRPTASSPTRRSARIRAATSTTGSAEQHALVPVPFLVVRSQGRRARSSTARRRGRCRRCR